MLVAIYGAFERLLIPKGHRRRVRGELEDAETGEDEATAGGHGRLRARPAPRELGARVPGGGRGASRQYRRFRRGRLRLFLLIHRCQYLSAEASSTKGNPRTSATCLKSLRAAQRTSTNCDTWTPLETGTNQVRPWRRCQSGSSPRVRVRRAVVTRDLVEVNCSKAIPASQLSGWTP
jgi:hypothetical protein